MIIFRTSHSEEDSIKRLPRCLLLSSHLKHNINYLFNIKKNDSFLKFFDKKKIPYSFQDDFLKFREEKDIAGIIFDLKFFDDSDLELISWAKKKQIKTIQITDFGLHQQDVDFYIDASADLIFPYGSDKKALNGPAFPVLHTKYRHFNKLKRKYRRRIKNIFIHLHHFGNFRKIRKIVDILNRFRFNIKIDPDPLIKRSQRKVLQRIYSRVTFVGETDNLARSFFQSDVALISAGKGSYEAAATGTPALYLYANKEQEFMATSFEKLGIGLKIDIDEVLSGERLLEKLNMLSLKNRMEMGAKGKNLIDGKGIHRIIDFFSNIDLV